MSWEASFGPDDDEQRGLQRIGVLTEVFAGRRTTESAAVVLGVSMRQVQRLLNRYQDGGGGALIHQARGRASNYQLSAGTREYAVEPVRHNYRDFGPTLAAEALIERHGVEISRETLRKWMVEAGLWPVPQAAPDVPPAKAPA